MACLVDFVGVFIGPLMRDDEFGRTGWFWFLHAVTPKMALKAYQRRARVAEREAIRDFDRTDRELASAELAIAKAPSLKARRLASHLDQQRRSYATDVKRAYFVNEINKRIVATIKDGQLARSTVALARLAHGQTCALSPEKLQKALSRYTHAQEQQQDSYEIFDDLLVGDDTRGDESDAESSRNDAINAILVELRTPDAENIAEPQQQPDETIRLPGKALPLILDNNDDDDDDNNSNGGSSMATSLQRRLDALVGK